MSKHIRTLLFGERQECTLVQETLGQMYNASGHTHECRFVNDLEEFDRILVDWLPSLIIVLADGAVGMESVYRSRQRHPDKPVFWFSDDREFSMQSYRLDCAYFATKPVTAEKIQLAVQRCHHIGIPLTAAN